MLEIRAAQPGFVVLDTTEQAPIMRFYSKDDSAKLVAELAIAESLHSLQSLDSVIYTVVSRTERI